MTRPIFPLRSETQALQKARARTTAITLRAGRHARLAASVILLALQTAGFGENPIIPETQREVAAQTDLPLRPPPSSSPQSTSEATSARDRSTGAGSDFGEQAIVQRRAHVEPWSAVADVQLFNTNNVALTPSNEKSDWYLRYGLAVSYTNRIKGPVFADFSLQQYLFRYTAYDVLNFDLTRFDGGFLVQAPWLSDAFVFTRYTFTRITEPWFGTASFTSHALDVGVQKVWKISRGQQVFAGAEASLSVSTDPDVSARNEYSATVGYSARLTEHLSATLSYRGSWNQYTSVDRQDWNHIVAFGLGYEVIDRLRLGANVSYANNQSNVGFANYENFVFGCNVALRMSF